MAESEASLSETRVFSKKDKSGFRRTRVKPGTIQPGTIKLRALLNKTIKCIVIFMKISNFILMWVEREKKVYIHRHCSGRELF